MLDVLLDSLIDLLKLIPFLFVAFLIIEYIEHKLSKKNEKILVNNKKIGQHEETFCNDHHGLWNNHPYFV